MSKGLQVLAEMNMVLQTSISVYIVVLMCSTYPRYVSGGQIEVCRNISDQALQMGCENCEGHTCMYKLRCCSLDQLDTVLTVDPQTRYRLDSGGCFLAGGLSFCLESLCVWKLRVRVGQVNPSFSMNTLGRAVTSPGCGNLLMIVTYDDKDQSDVKNVFTLPSPTPTTTASKPVNQDALQLLIPLAIGVGLVVLACVSAVIFFIFRIRRQSIERKKHSERMTKAKQNLIWYIESTKAVKNCVGEKSHFEARSSRPSSSASDGHKPASVHSQKSSSRASSESLIYNCRKTLTALPSIYEQSVTVASESSRASSARSLLPAPSIGCISETGSSVPSIGDSYQSVNSLGSALTRHSLLLSQRT